MTESPTPQDDLALVERVVRAGELPDDDPSGDVVRGAADRVLWRWWRSRHLGDWDVDGLEELSASLWARSRAACRDDPRAASLEFARRVLTAVRPRSPS